MKRLNRLFVALILSLLIITSVSVKGAGYNYSHRNEPIHSTSGFDFSQTLTFDRLGISAEEFDRPEDLFIYNQELIYIVDSKSNTLFVYNTGFQLIKKINAFKINREEYTAKHSNLDKVVTNKVSVITDPKTGEQSIKFENTLSPISFDDEGNGYIYLNSVAGVHRFENNIYLADKMNNQIVIIDSQDYRVKQVVTTPEDQIFKWPNGEPAKGEPNSRQVTFKPTKVVTDNDGRIYTISDEVYRGIIEIGRNGQFNRFTGVNYVTLSPWELFWRSLSTEAQLAKKETIINTIFTSLTMDHKGFIYATSRATEKNGVVTNDREMIKLINPRSNDVLKRNGYNVPKGDIVYSRVSQDLTQRGPSRFSAIASTDYGTYTVVDSKLGRLFTYDDEGYLLYVSGSSGQQLDKMKDPVAVKYLGEDLLVLDRANKSVMIFKPTPIANIINSATYHYYHGDFEQSSSEWEKVVHLNSTYEYAYVGIGKSLLKEGKYKEAMKMFEIGFDQTNYSKAYKLHRDAKIRIYFAPVMYTVIALIIGKKGYKLYKKKKENLEVEEGEE